MKNRLKPILYQLLIGTLGNLLVFLRPKKARQLSENGLTLLINNNMSIPERLMRGAIFKKLEKKQDYDTLAELHQNYWINKGYGFFLATNNRLKNVALPDCVFIFNLLEKELIKESNQFKTLVEIGSGNGSVLDYLSSKFPQLDRLVGIDLSKVQTDNNKDKYKEKSKLEFVASDAFDWVNEHGHGDMILVTFCGVLEYFTEKRLRQLFDKLNGLGRIIFVAIEPKAIDHDFTTNPNSKVYGGESSFSHNYPKLFKNSGFRLWHLSQKKLFNSNANLFSFLGAKN